MERRNRSMIKRKMRLLTGLLAVMLCCAALTPAAFAYAYPVS